MGLAEGGISFITYRVDGERPDDFRGWFVQRLQLHAFEPLTPESEHDISYGWVPIDNILEPRFTTTDVYWNQYAVASMRIDRWSIPPVLLKAGAKNEEAKLLQLQNREALSRTERGELLERERSRLKKQTLPSVRALDMAWNLETGVLRFSSHSRVVNEFFTELFERTTSLRLVPDNPYMAALHCGLEDELIGRLADVEPARLLVT